MCCGEVFRSCQREIVGTLSLLSLQSDHYNGTWVGQYLVADDDAAVSWAAAEATKLFDGSE